MDPPIAFSVCIKDRVKEGGTFFPFSHDAPIYVIFPTHYMINCHFAPVYPQSATEVNIQEIPKTNS